MSVTCRCGRVWSWVWALASMPCFEILLQGSCFHDLFLDYRLVSGLSPSPWCPKDGCWTFPRFCCQTKKSDGETSRVTSVGNVQLYFFTIFFLQCHFTFSGQKIDSSQLFRGKGGAEQWSVSFSWAVEAVSDTVLSWARRRTFQAQKKNQKLREWKRVVSWSRKVTQVVWGSFELWRRAPSLRLCGFSQKISMGWLQTLEINNHSETCWRHCFSCGMLVEWLWNGCGMLVEWYRYRANTYVEWYRYLELTPMWNGTVISSCGMVPPEKLLGGGLSTPVHPFCLFCTIISNKICILD